MTDALVIDAEGLDRLSCSAKTDPTTGKKTVKAKTICEAEGIHPAYRIGPISGQVQAAAQADGILRNETPLIRGIIPIPVVVQSGLDVMILPLEA